MMNGKRTLRWAKSDNTATASANTATASASAAHDGSEICTSGNQDAAFRRFWWLLHGHVYVVANDKNSRGRKLVCLQIKEPVPGMTPNAPMTGICIEKSGRYQSSIQSFGYFYPACLIVHVQIVAA